MRKDVKELNDLIETISSKVVSKTIGEKYLLSRMAVIVSYFDKETNSASVIIPTDMNSNTIYKYPNRTGKATLSPGEKVYLVYQTNNISQGWLESSAPLKMVSDVGNAKIFYGTCSSADSEVNKVVVCDNFNSSDLITGAVVFVTFDNTNSGSVDSLTMDVNGTGAKPIKALYNGNISNLALVRTLKTNETYMFIYDGTYWICSNGAYPSNTISIGTGVTGTATTFNGTSNITIPVTELKEAYAVWGGKNIAGDITPDDMGCIDEFGHNKLALLPGSCITVEYTTNGGTSWIDYGLTDTQKTSLVTNSSTACTIGKGTVSATGGTLTNANCGNYKVRVKISTRDSGGTQRVYTNAKKMLINFSSNGATGCKCLVERRTIANYNNNVDTWVQVGNFDVSGWSGWNSIPLNLIFGGSSTQTSQNADLRFTLSITGVNTSYSSQAQFLDFRLIGSTNWATPSEMAKTGHMYTFDTAKNVTFPAGVTATGFTGDLSGNATTASKLGSSTVGASDTPIYLNGGTATSCDYPVSGSWFKGVPSVSSAGVMEIGRYIDFHPTNGSELDYSKRIDAGTGTTKRTLTLPDKTGTLAVTDDIPTSFSIAIDNLWNTNTTGTASWSNFGDYIAYMIFVYGIGSDNAILTSGTIPAVLFGTSSTSTFKYRLADDDSYITLDLYKTSGTGYAKKNAGSSGTGVAKVYGIKTVVQ